MKHITAYLKALSQTFFFDNPLFGAALLVLLGVFYRYPFSCALIASLIGHFHSMRNSTPKLLRATGLIQINSFFFGLAMANLFQESAWLYAIVIAGSLTIPLVTKASFEILQHWKLSPFVFPYLLTTWAIWISGSSLHLTVNSDAMVGSAAFLEPLHPSWRLVSQVLNSIALSNGRLLYLPDAWFGISLLAIIAVFSPRRGFYFFLGSVIGSAASFAVSNGTDTAAVWEYGYLSYSSGLIGLGLASFPEKFGFRMIACFCLISAFLTLALDRTLSGAHVPLLSLPYVLTMWLALLSRVPRVSISWADTSGQPRKTPLRQASTPVEKESEKVA